MFPAMHSVLKQGHLEEKEKHKGREGGERRKKGTKRKIKKKMEEIMKESQTKKL
jgi:hypothetical protein